jgi:hypothetical protein
MIRFICLLAAMLAPTQALAQQKRPTLYVDKIEIGNAEIDVTYSYVSGFPPDPDEVLQVAGAQCRRLGYDKAVRSSDPTLRRCLSVNTIGGGCAREAATDNFGCTR